MISDIGRSTPLVIVFVSLSCGILLWLHDIPAFFFCLIMLSCLLSRTRIIHAAIGVMLGVVSIWLAPSWVDLEEGLHTIQGVVSSSEYKEGTYRMILKDVTADGKEVRGNAQLSMYKGVVDLAPGSVVSALARVRTQMGLGNKSEFDYKLYLLSKGIVITGSVMSPDALTLRRYVRPEGLRYAVDKSLSKLSRPEAEVLKAMLTGDTSGITDSIRDTFNSLGISHLIAISGLHMSIIFFIGYSLTFSLLRILPLIAIRFDTPLLAHIGGIIGVICFTLLVGPNIPTLRAAVMAVCVIFGIFMLRKINVLDALAIAGIIILLKWPYSIYSASFLLSFAAVLGIIGVIQKGASAPGWIHVFTIPVVACVFTLPIVIYMFGFVSWVGILANIAVVPFFSIAIMPLGIAGLLAFPISGFMSSLIFSLAEDAIGLLMLMGDTFGSLIAVPRPSIYWVYVCYAGLVIAFFAARSRWRIVTLALLGTAIVILPVIERHINITGPPCFDFISVGQGDSILLTDGPHAMLIDAGDSSRGYDMGRHVVGPHLLQRGITSLDLIVITHSHPDHIGGVPYILERFLVKEVWTNTAQDLNPDFQEVIRITKEKSIPVRAVCLGDGVHLGGLSIKVLNPQIRLDKFEGKLDQNLHSIALMAGDRAMKGLFMGDADMFGELMVTHRGIDISADVLKVAHHGGRRSCLDPFLNSVRPKIAIISCGSNNCYGDPSADALLRLKGHGVEIFRTDLNGEIIVTGRPGGMDVKSLR